jgi:protein-S-isoprenylcysteine O-methyltransferase
MSKSEEVVQDSLEAKLRQRMAQMQPEDTFTMKADERGSRIPNTLLSVAVISFCLGSVFLWGLRLAIFGPGVGSWWWTTPQLGFFIAALTAFHFGEFATTAGWNRKVCSVDCEPNVLSDLDQAHPIPCC